MGKPKSASAKKPPKAKKWKAPPIVCESVEQTDELLREWSEMDATEESAKADKAAAVKAATDAMKKRLWVAYSEGKVTFADERLRITDAIWGFATAHRAEILEHGLKSRQLNYGELGWRDGLDSIVPYAGVPEEGEPKVFESLLMHLRAALTGFAGLTPAMLQCLVINLAWSRDLLHVALAGKMVTPEEMRLIGLRLEAGKENFFVKPFKTAGAALTTEATSEDPE